ncbi:MAG: adaptor protein MecA [Lachnospiraceae bacterium]|nr:adaptor protein MecA [Lachnospiraceae bacterium]
MKFEQINERQIRCTIEPDDFQKMHLSIQDLAYGNERTRRLFRELLDQAFDELNFHAEDTPLMIEAIPLAENTVSLLITKVDDPEELDTRFSVFSDSVMDEDDNDFELSETFHSLFERADEIINLFSGQTEDLNDSETPIPFGEPVPKLTDDFNRVFRFSDLDEIGEAARSLSGAFQGRSSVYKDARRNCYLLILHKDRHTPEEFNSICNRLSEYAGSSRDRIAPSYYMEHFEPLIQDKALEVLAAL